MNNLQRILIGLLVVQLGIGVLVFWPRNSAASSIGAPLFGEIKDTDITSLAITDDTGASVKLANVGGQWVLSDQGDYPADSSKITPVLTKLAGLTSARLVTRTPDSQSKLKVADTAFMRQIDIETAGGVKQTLFIGSSAGANTTHVRVGGRNEVYLARGLSTYEVNATAFSWVDPVYFTVTQSDISKVTLANAYGQLVFEKGAEDKWTMEGLAADEVFSDNNFSTLLSRVSTVRMTEPLGKTEEASYGLAQPAAMVTIVAQVNGEEKTYSLAVGAKDSAATDYVVKSSESQYYVRVSEYNVQDLVQKTRDDYIQQPPTPTPAAS